MSRRHEIGVGALVLGAGGLLAWMALQVGALRAPGDLVELTVRMPDAAGLGEGAVVSVAGVQIGRVGAMRLAGTQAEAAVTLDPAAGIREDARFHVRARSLLGEKYLAIEPVPGSDAPLLADGAVIDDVPAQVDVDELLAAMAPLIDAVDPAALRAFSDAVKADPERARRMLDDAEVSLHNLRLASEKLPGLADDTSTTLAQARQAARAAETTLAAAMPVLAKADAATARLDALLAAVPPEQLPQLLTELQRAVQKGNVVLERVDGSTDDLQELLRKANAITRADLDRFALARGVYVRFLKPDLGDDGVLEDTERTKRRKRRAK